MDQDLKKLQKLTEDALQAIAAEDVSRLIDLLADRQEQMDLIDLRRTQGHAFSAENLQQIEQMVQQDDRLNRQAEKLLESYRNNLKRVRRFQKVKGYQPFAAEDGRFLDTME